MLTIGDKVKVLGGSSSRKGLYLRVVRKAELEDYYELENGFSYHESDLRKVGSNDNKRRYK